jgi:CDP-diacylglycerol pyrophosphatase
MIVGQSHSVSAASRGELWFVVHDLCLPAYRSIGVAFPCAEVSIAKGLDRGFAVLNAPSSAAHVIVVPTTRMARGYKGHHHALERPVSPTYLTPIVR